MLPQIESYGRYSNDNYGAHTLKVCLGSFTLYYSYNTIVAYRDDTDGLICRENNWDTTTGKHLNWIEPDHKRRIPGKVFEKKLADMLSRHLV
jgi:hypothetical protein